MRQGWMPNGKDREAGFVYDSLARSEAKGDAQIYLGTTALRINMAPT
jgi:hypothetical protein